MNIRNQKQMYKIRKTMEVAGAHQLSLNYDSPCQNLHGHNWIITVELSAPELDENGMIMDFKVLKALMNKHIHDRLDHKNINDVVRDNPTAENMAFWIYDHLRFDLSAMFSIAQCTSVEVQESQGNVASYEVPFNDC